MTTIANRHGSTVGAAGTKQPADAPGRLPWTYGDILKAILAVTVATVVTGMAAGLIASSLLDSGQDYEDDATAYAIVLVPSMVLVEIFLLAAAVWWGPHKHRLPLSSLGLRTPEQARAWLPPGMAVAGLAAVYGFEVLVALAGGDAATTPDAVFENAGPFMVVAVGAILMAPVIEEIFFRGFMFGGLRGRMDWRWAALLSSVVFALAHLSLYGIPPIAAIGFMFAWSYQYTGSLRPGMIAHALINTVTVGVGLLTV